MTTRGVTPAVAPPTVDAVLLRLATVMDPELPMISIVDLGMVGAVEVDPAGIRVELLPTYVGCPALAVIEAAVVQRLVPLARDVAVVPTFATPWTSDRISPAGLAALRSAGIAPPTAPEATRCPWCDSGRVALDNLFGATQCRALYFCRACRQPFEAIKPI